MEAHTSAAETSAGFGKTPVPPPFGYASHDVGGCAFSPRCALAQAHLSWGHPVFPTKDGGISILGCPSIFSFVTWPDVLGINVPMGEPLEPDRSIGLDSRARSPCAVREAALSWDEDRAAFDLQVAQVRDRRVDVV